MYFTHFIIYIYKAHLKHFGLAACSVTHIFTHMLVNKSNPEPVVIFALYHPGIVSLVVNRWISMERNWHSGYGFLLEPARYKEKHLFFEGISLFHTHTLFTWALMEECEVFNQRPSAGRSGQ